MKRQILTLLTLFLTLNAFSKSNGVGMGFISDISLSLRAPAGAGYYFHSRPLEAFAEIVPTLQIIGPEDLHFWIGGFLGARWYF